MAKKGSQLTVRTATEIQGGEFVILGYAGRSYQMTLDELKKFIGIIENGGGSVDLTQVSTDILPLADASKDIGSLEKRWKKIYSTALTVKAQSVDEEEVNIHDGGIEGKIGQDIQWSIDGSGKANFYELTVNGADVATMQYVNNELSKYVTTDTLTKNYVSNSSLTEILKKYYESGYVDFLLSSKASTGDLNKTNTQLGIVQTDVATLKSYFQDTDDVDDIINKWRELEAFLAGQTETSTLADLLTLKADKSTVVAINSRVTDLEDADFVDIDSLRTALEDYYTKEEVNDLLGEAGGVDLTGYVNEIAASGTGNGIASVSKDGSKLTFTKATFLTSHQSLDGYINNVGDEGSGNVITDYRKSGKSLVLQKGLSVYSKAEVDKLIGDISIPSLDGYVTNETFTSSLNNLANTYLSFRGGGTVSGATTFSGGLSVQNYLILLGVNVAAGSSGLTFDGKIPMYSGDAYTKSEADKEFHPLTTVDTAPTISSSNLVTSGGVAKAVADLAESAERLYQRKGSYLTASSSLSSANLDKNTIIIAGTSVSLGGSITQNQLISNLGLKGLAFKDSVDYNDLSNKPTIPSAITESTVSGWGFITEPTLNDRLADYLSLGGGQIDGALTIAYGADLILKAGPSSTGDSGDLVFYNYSGKEIGRIWHNAGVFCLRYAENDSTKEIIHSGNISDYTLAKDSNGTVLLNGTLYVDGASASIELKEGAIKSNLSGTDSWSIDDSGNGVLSRLTVEGGRDAKIILNNTDTESKYQYISFRQNGTEYGVLGTFYDDNLIWNQNYILHSKNYSNYALPLSGGTISHATNHMVLTINSNASSGTYLVVKNNSADKASVGWNNLDGAFLYNRSADKIIGITDSGTPYYSDGTQKTLIHSGNISDYTLANINGVVTHNGTLEVLSADNSVTIKNGSIISNTGGTNYWSIDDSGNGVFNSLKVGGSNVALASDLSGYLPLSGGELVKKSSNPLTINRTGTGAPGIEFKKGDTPLGSLGVGEDFAPYFYSRRSSSLYTIIHTGNISSYAITSATLDDFPRLNGTSPSGASATGTWGIDISGSAAKLGGIDAGSYFYAKGTGILNNEDANDYWANGAYLNQTGNGSNNTNFPQTYSIFVNFTSGQSNYVSQLSLGTNQAYYRTKIDNWGGWIEFVTSNNINNYASTLTVAKANRLVTSGGATYGAFGSGYTEFGLTTWENYLNGSKVIFRNADFQTMLINSSGNVTIGDSDLAGASYKLYVDSGSSFLTCYDRSYIDIGPSSTTFGLRFTILGNGNTFIQSRRFDNTTAYYNIILQELGGNVGIGTTNPNTKLHVVGGAKVEGALSTYGITATTTAATDAAFTHYVGSTKLWWVSSYNNCANFHTALYVQSGSSPIKVATVNDLSSYLLKAGDTISGSLTFSSTSVSHIIGNANNVLQLLPGTGSAPVLPIKIAKLSSGRHTIYCDEDQAYDLGTSSYSYYYVYSRYSSASSDATKKNIIGNIPLTTAQIANAPAVSFTWKDSGEKSHGTIAQYWKGILPELVSGEEGSYGLNYAVLGVVSSIILARNIETHEQRIARLEKEKTEMKAEAVALKAEIVALKSVIENLKQSA